MEPSPPPGPAGQQLRCVCGGAFTAPFGVPSVICPYCRQQIAVPMAGPMPMAPPMYAPQPMYAAPGSQLASEGKRSWGLILVLLATAAIAIGGATKSWLVASRGDDAIRIGLLGAEECEEDSCREIDYDDADDKIMKVLGTVGKIAAAGSIALIGMLVWVGILAQARRPVVGPAIAGLIIAGLAATGGAMWMIQMKKEIHMPMDLGYSFLLYMTGTVMAFIACVLLRTPSRA